MMLESEALLIEIKTYETKQVKHLRNIELEEATDKYYS